MQDTESTLFTKQAIAARVAQLGAQISADYNGGDLVCVGVLKGSFIFMADLVRELNLPVTVDFIEASSYGTSTQSSGMVTITKDLRHSIAGRDVLIVEDIIDTGVTLSYLVNYFKSQAPHSVKICTLVDKPARRRIALSPDYCGFTIPDAFVVGYGLDYAERYRNLPDICVLKPEVYSE